jgi:predicted helicase
MDLNLPKHPDARYFAKLFKRDSYRSFRLDVEAVIAGLATPFERGKAFEVWAEGFLVAVEGLDPRGLWRPEDDLLPRLERQRLGLPRADIGIDSVYLSETDGAYQFKFRIGRLNLTRDDLATFLALAYQCQFPNKIVVTNSERIDSLTHHAVTLIRGSRLDELSPEQLGQIADYLQARPVKKDNLLEPRQDQFEAVCEINHLLRQSSRAQEYGFCGTGKTLVQLWLMESRAPRTTLVLVPSLWLLSQIRNDWLEQRRTPFMYRCICSDEKIKREDGEITLDDCNFPVFTRPRI